MKKKSEVLNMVEDVVGCKWSLSVLAMVQQGIQRPGAMTRHQEGLSTKVLNERLNKLLRYGILAKEVFPEVPPKVEYRFTEFGKGFCHILASIEELQVSLQEKSATGSTVAGS